MACAERGRLWALCAGEVGADERAALEEHLALCEGCARELSAVRATREVLALARTAEARVDWRRADDQVRSMAERRFARLTPRRWGLGALALGGAAAVAMAVVASRAPRPPDLVAGAPEAPAAEGPLAVVLATDEGTIAAQGREARALRAGSRLSEGATVVTPARGRALVLLPEGTRLRLAAGTALSLPRASAAEVALILERGRVAVRASHAPRQQFVVRAGEASVRVVGTAFSVALTERQVVLAVAEGQVLLDPGNRELRLVGAGQRIAVERASASVEKGELRAADEPDFRELDVPLAARAAPRPAASVGPPPAAAPPALAVGQPPGASSPPAGLPPASPSSPAPGPAEPAAAARAGLQPISAEEFFLRRAQESLGRGDCARFLEGLSEYLDDAEDAWGREWARVLRARCLAESRRGAEADAEYRRYLREFPTGRYAAEARRAVAH